MSTAAPDRAALGEMTEDELEANVRTLGALTGWTLIYHTHDSRRSDPGFLDLVMVNPRQGRILFVELKTRTGRIRPKQRDWLAGLAAVGMEAALWRPAQWFDGSIARALKGERLTPHTDPKD